MKYKINQGFVTEKIDEKTIIFDEDKSVLYTFNKTASYIFKKIKEGKKEKEITNLLTKRYQIKEDRAKRDVKSLISELLKNKIISF